MSRMISSGRAPRRTILESCKKSDGKLVSVCRVTLHRIDAEVSIELGAWDYILAIVVWCSTKVVQGASKPNLFIANGSDIRIWWIYHHFLAMVMALISLTWEMKGQPDCSSKQRGYNSSCDGQSCKGLQCIYRTNTSIKDYALA